MIATAPRNVLRKTSLVLAASLTAVVMSGGSPVSAEQAGQDSGNTINVTILGFDSDKGQALCKAFVKKKAFPWGEHVAVARATIKDKRARCRLTGVPGGDVAVAVAHDKNKNGKVDRNLLGIPKERYGFSNGAKAGTFGPPPFEKASIRYNGQPSSMTIPLE